MAIDKQSLLRSEVLTASGAVGTSGKESAVVSVAAQGDSALTEVILRDGTSGSGTQLVVVRALPNSTDSIYLGDGVHFPNGVYASITNSSSGTVTVAFRQTT